MFDLLKQAIFASVGLASLTREKAEQLAAEVVPAGQSFPNKSRRSFKPISPAVPNSPVRNSRPRSIAGSTTPSSNWASSRPV